MKLETRIVIPPKYSSEIESDICIRRLEGFLYQVIVGQEIKTIVDNKYLLMKVINVSDILYEDAIYRCIEVVVIDTKIK